jgi:Uma2 family endonuclease
MSIGTNVPLPTVPEPEYPDSDVEPMGETDLHMVALILLRQALEDLCAGHPDRYVASDLFLYYERGNPAARKAPDVMVFRGVANRPRRSFKTWVENAHPWVIFEIASEATWREDVREKATLYAQLGVVEYFVFDPEGAYLQPPLQGFRLRDQGAYVSLGEAAEGGLISVELGLRLVAEGSMLRLIERATGKPVLTRQEQTEQEKLRAEQEKQRADQAEQRAEQEKQRADQEKQRAEALEAELARLRATLTQREANPNDAGTA